MIFAFVRDEKLKKFLKLSLKEKGIYKDIYPKPSFELFEDKKTFLNSLNFSRPSILIIEESLLPCISKIEKIDGISNSYGCPTITLIGEDIKKGLQKISRYNIPFYILPPYRKEDLLCKLKAAFQISTERKFLQAIIDISSKVSSTLDVFEILYHTVKTISEIIPVSRCSIIKISSPRYAHVVASYEDPKIKGLKLDLKKYPEIKEALKTKKPIIIKDAQKDPLMKEVLSFISPLGIKSIIVIPILYHEEAIGALFLRTSRKKVTFSTAEINFLQSAASASANALYNAFLFDEIKQEKNRLEKLAITDYLTGLYNNRYFLHRLEEEFEKAKRYNTPLSCIMIDLDFFKSINDRFGHKKGDGVLRELGRLLRKNTRKGDIIARYGGEEFIVLLPHTDIEGARREAERLKRLICETKFDFLNESITASFGIATWPWREIKVSDDIITLADTALYNAKKEGRNRICIYPQV